MPGRRGWLNFPLFCHVPLTTFYLCYTLDRTKDPNPLRMPTLRAAVYLSVLWECKMAGLTYGRSQSALESPETGRNPDRCNVPNNCH